MHLAVLVAAFAGPNVLRGKIVYCPVKSVSIELMRMKTMISMTYMLDDDRLSMAIPGVWVTDPRIGNVSVKQPPIQVSKRLLSRYPVSCIVLHSSSLRDSAISHGSVLLARDALLRALQRFFKCTSSPGPPGPATPWSSHTLQTQCHR